MTIRVCATSQARMSCLAEQIRELHRGISRSLRTRGVLNERSLATYVHVLSTEDVIVQVLLREKPPLMLSLAPLECGQSWRSDRASVRRYAAATHRATATYLATLQRRGEAEQRNVERVLEHFLIPVLARAAREFAPVDAHDADVER